MPLPTHLCPRCGRSWFELSLWRIFSCTRCRRRYFLRLRKRDLCWSCQQERQADFFPSGTAICTICQAAQARAKGASPGEPLWSRPAVPRTVSPLMKNPLKLLEEAEEYARTGDYRRARELAGEAIQANPQLVEAYERRAFYARVDGDLDAAIDDYDRAIEIDPQNAEAWKFRGACKFQKASLLDDEAESGRLLGEAHPDYQKASQLKPDDEQAGLALLELETCINKYREAVGTAGVWWRRIQQPSNKGICAWLGAIAFILAGRPDQKWAHFREFLERDDWRISDTEWSLVEINALLQRLAADPSITSEQLEKVRIVHRSFLSHFGKGGPRIV